jgi:GH35 family endo-1,4-beta-xylanase
MSSVEQAVLDKLIERRRHQLHALVRQLQHKGIPIDEHKVFLTPPCSVRQELKNLIGELNAHGVHIDEQEVFLA